MHFSSKLHLRHSDKLYQVSFLICEKCLINSKTLASEFQGTAQKKMEV